MSAEPPPPLQISPDGKYQWDGQRWTPVQPVAPEQAHVRHISPDGKYYWDGQRWASMVLAGQEGVAYPHKKGNTRRNVAIGIIGLFALLFVIRVANGGPNSSSSPSISPSPAAQSGPQGDNISNIDWTVGSGIIKFDYAPSQTCSKLSFHYSFVDASGNELGSVDDQPSAFYADTIYHITFFMLQQYPPTQLDRVPVGTDRVNITPHCG